MKNTSIAAMTPDEFRDWCKSIGFRFTFDEDSGTWYYCITPEDLQDFCQDVLEYSAEQK